MIIYAILRFCQIGWYRLEVLSIAKKAGFMWQRKYFRSSTQVLSIAIEAGFVLEVISLSYSSHAVQGL